MSHQTKRGFAKKKKKKKKKRKNWKNHNKKKKKKKKEKKKKKKLDKSQKIPLIHKLSIRSDRYKYMLMTKKNTSN